MKRRWIAGCMTGTSLDGIDAALVEIEGRGLGMRAAVRATASRPLGELGRRLRAAANQEPLAAGRMARLALELGEGCAALISELVGEGRKVDLAAVHGQTVFHEPPVSWQVVNPHPIVRELGAPVVFDLRGADLAAGGQGAPITPLADWVLFRDARVARAVVNLGGFANWTWLPPSGEGDEAAGAAVRAVRGGDICVCNQLLDAVARRCFDQPFDEDGRRAMSGQVVSEAEAELREVLRGQREAGRSLGTGDEARSWVEAHAGRWPDDDVARTCCEAIGRVIGEAVGETEEVIAAGGGARNAALVEAIGRHTDGAAVRRSDDLGVPGPYREAAAMAVLGALAQDGVAITLPQITGRGQRAGRAGCWVRP